MGKRNSVLRFNPDDWIKDTRSLSLEERGAWFEFLLLMHGAERPGRLELAKKPYPIEPLASAIGAVPARTREILDKLLALGVASMDPQTGAIFCRRMVREAERAAGKVSSVAARPPGITVPPALIGLHLFASDWRLCAKWDKLWDSWKKAFPLVELMGELRKAHAWQMARKPKVDNARFLYNWFSSQQDRNAARQGAPIRQTSAPNQTAAKTSCKLCVNGSSMRYVSTKDPRGGPDRITMTECEGCHPKFAVLREGRP